MKLYVDTNIFLDCLLERKNLAGKDSSAPAQKLFYRAIKCEFFIVYSKLTATEIAKNIDLSKTIFLFEALKKKLVLVDYTSQEEELAKKIGANNYADALHAIIAEKTNCDCLITRNIKDYLNLGLKIKPKLPENI